MYTISKIVSLSLIPPAFPIIKTKSFRRGGKKKVIFRKSISKIIINTIKNKK